MNEVLFVKLLGFLLLAPEFAEYLGGDIEVGGYDLLRHALYEMWIGFFEILIALRYIGTHEQYDLILHGGKLQ